MPTIGEMFAGAGFLALGLERAGLEHRWFCEVDKAASSVLARHWPDVPNLGDVTKVDWSKVEPVDVLCGGGWPCQPFSSAGKQLGEHDPRYLWPEVARALRALRPGHFLMEQSPALLTRKFRDVWLRCLSDLADLGFDAEWTVLRASDVGVPHRRARLILVAHAIGDESERRGGPVELGGASAAEPGEGDQRQRTGDAAGGSRAIAADTEGERRGSRRRSRAGSEGRSR